MKAEKAYTILQRLDHKDEKLVLDQNTINYLKNRELVNVLDEYSISVKKSSLDRAKKIDARMKQFDLSIMEYEDEIIDLTHKMNSFFYIFTFGMSRHDDELRLEELNSKMKNAKKVLKKFENERKCILDTAKELKRYVNMGGYYVGITDLGIERMEQIKSMVPEKKDIDYDAFEDVLTKNDKKRQNKGDKMEHHEDKPIKNLW